MEDSSAINKDVNFALGFNDVDFSDRILRLEITPLANSSKNGGRENYLNWFSSIHDDDGGGDSEDFGSDFIVKTFYVSSLMLAARSPFFYRLFKKGIRESYMDEFTLRINASEEAAFMDILNSIYHKPLNATSRSKLMEVMIAANKFEVTSCTTHCVDLLLKFPMTTESAVSYLELHSVVFVSEVSRPVIDSAKRYLCAQFSSFTKSQKEAAMSFPLCAVEVVLGSDSLQVKSEKDLFNFIMKWANLHYPKLEERRDILTKRLLRFVCFPALKRKQLSFWIPSKSCFEYKNS